MTMILKLCSYYFISILFPNILFHIIVVNVYKHITTIDPELVALPTPNIIQTPRSELYSFIQH